MSDTPTGADGGSSTLNISSGRPSRFLSKALAKLDQVVNLTVGAPNVALSHAPTSPVKTAFGRAAFERIKIERDTPAPIELEPFQLDENRARRRHGGHGGNNHNNSTGYVDGDSASFRAKMVSECHLDDDLPPEIPGEFDEADDETDPNHHHVTAEERMAEQLMQRQSTFLTSLDMETQLQLMRAHYQSYSSGIARAEMMAAETAKSHHAAAPGSRTSRASTSHSSRAYLNGSLSARPSSKGIHGDGDDVAMPLPPTRPSKSSHATLTHLNSNLNSTSSLLGNSGWTSVGDGGQHALVFNSAGDRFPSEEKHELGLCNPVSLYTTLPSELSMENINKSHKMSLKFRLPRSSELEKTIFVKALPGTVGIPLMSPHSINGYVSCIPQRNLFLLNPNNLDPITPGPGAYLDLSRAEYERGKVKELGGVMKTVTATNGILKERYRRQYVIVAEGSHVADTVSLTKSGRANTSQTYQAAIYGTGSLTNIARRRLKKTVPGLRAKHESVTTFGATERPVGEWEIQRNRTFLGPGWYDESNTNGFSKYNTGLTEKLVAAKESAQNHAQQQVDNSGPGEGPPNGTNDLTEEQNISLVASKLNYTPLPSALTEIKRDALTSVSKDVLENPGPGSYFPRPNATQARAPVTRIVPVSDTMDLDAMRKVHQGKAGETSMATVKLRRKGKAVIEEDPRVDRGYFPAAARSFALEVTRTPGPGAYAPDFFAPHPNLSTVTTESFSWNHLPNLAGFNSSAKRADVGLPQRGLNQNELRVLAGAHQDPVLKRKKQQRRDSSEFDLKLVDDRAPKPPITTDRAPASPERPPTKVEEAKQAEKAVVLEALERAHATRMRQLALMAGAMVSEDGVSGVPDTQGLLDAHSHARAAESHAKSLVTADPDNKGLLSREAQAALAHKKHWEDEQRRAAICDKATQLQLTRTARLQSIEKRAVHIEQRSLWLLTQQRWLALLVHTRFIYAMWRVNSGRQSVLREIAAAVKIQASWVEFKTKREVKDRFRRLKEGLQKNMMLYVIQHRIRRKNVAANLISRFFRDYFLRRGEKMFRLVQNFKGAIIRIQRFWRKCFRKHQAAVELNLRFWDKLMNEQDAVTLQQKRKEAAALAAAESANNPNKSLLIPLSSPNKKNRPKVSAALVAKYNLSSSTAPQPPTTTQPPPPSHHMNALKELILEKLHERRLRLELERKKQIAMQQALHGSVGTGTGSGLGHSPSWSPNLSRRGSLGSPESSPLAGPLQPRATGINSDALMLEESYEAERQRYKALFAAPQVKAGSKKQRRDSNSDLNIRTPLQDHLRRLYQAELDARAKLLRAQSNQKENKALEKLQAHPHGPVPRQLSKPDTTPTPPPPPEEPPKRKRLPTPKGRKPLYTPRPQPTIIFPVSALSAKAQAAELYAATPRQTVRGAVKKAMKIAAEKKKVREEKAASAKDEEEDEDQIVPVPVPPSNSISTSFHEEDPDALPTSWTGLVVSLPIRTNLLRQVLRETRHSFYRTISTYRRTLDEFLTSKLSSNESSVERARLFLTGTSSKLLQDQADYIKSHPIPRFKPFLERSLLKLLIIQGYLDQAEIMDDFAARRAQVLALIQSTAQPHAVPDLFHSETVGTSGANENKKPVKGFSSSVGSNVNPSPVRMLRLQAQAAQQAQALTSSSSSPRPESRDSTTQELYPPRPPMSLQHSRLLESLRQGVVTIPTPGVLQSVLDRNQASAAGSSSTTTNTSLSSTLNIQLNSSSIPPSPSQPPPTSPNLLQTPPRSNLLATTPSSLNKTSNALSPYHKHPAGSIFPRVPMRALVNRRSSFDSSQATPAEISDILRSHATVSVHQHFPNAEIPVIEDQRKPSSIFDNVQPLSPSTPMTPVTPVNPKSNLSPTLTLHQRPSTTTAPQPPRSSTRVPEHHIRQPTLEASQLFKSYHRKASTKGVMQLNMGGTGTISEDVADEPKSPPSPQTPKKFDLLATKYKH